MQTSIAVLALDLRQESDIDICKRPDGTLWHLGSGSYGQVSGGCPGLQSPFVCLTVKERAVVCQQSHNRKISFLVIGVQSAAGRCAARGSEGVSVQCHRCSNGGVPERSKQLDTCAIRCASICPSILVRSCRRGAQTFLRQADPTGGHSEVVPRSQHCAVSGRLHHGHTDMPRHR